MNTDLGCALEPTAIEVKLGWERIKVRSKRPRRRYDRNIELLLGIPVIPIVIVLLVQLID